MAFDHQISQSEVSEMQIEAGSVDIYASSTQDVIDNFDCFVIGLSAQEEHEPWKEHWSIFEQHDGICFYRLSRDEYFRNVTMAFKILVDKDMNVLIYKNEVEADSTELSWILKLSKLRLWSQFYRLMGYYQKEPEVIFQSSPVPHIKSALAKLNNIGESENIFGLIDMIKSQLSLVLKEMISDEEVVVKVEETESDCLIHSKQDFDRLELEEMETEADGDTFDKDDKTKTAVKEKSIGSKRKVAKRYSSKSNENDKVETEIKCKHCERVFSSKLQRRNHFHRSHVSSSQFFIMPTQVYELVIFRLDPFVVIAAEKCLRHF